MPTSGRTFSEREFYLAEFRDRSIGFAWPGDEVPKPEVLETLLPGLLSELVANRTRVVLLSPREDVLALAQRLAADRAVQRGGAHVAEIATEVVVADPPPAAAFAARPWAPDLWRTLREHGCAGVRLPGRDFERACQRVALGLRLAKVVWVQSEAPVHRVSAASPGADRSAPFNRASVVDLAHLGALLDGTSASENSGDLAGGRIAARPESQSLLEAIDGMIRGGLPSVNVCAAEDVAKELLTYAGAGTFFTRDRYAEVRTLSLDDYDQASDLIQRGEEDGFLLPRDPGSRDRVLAHGVGLFIEGRYLAGIGALLPYSTDSAKAAGDSDGMGTAGSRAGGRALEIASLYALTRYSGEGVGHQIVEFALERAREESFTYAFSCTTSERVADFFVRNGFERVAFTAVPPSKWKGYDAKRRERVLCLRKDLA